MRTDVKQLLHSHNRSFRRRPGKWTFGPTGARLWADCLESAPGFIGRIDFIHKLNLPLLFTVRVDGCDVKLEPMNAEWYPDEAVFHYEDFRAVFDERKLITWNDQALSLQTWTNKLYEPITLTLVLPEGCIEREPYEFDCPMHGIFPVMCAGHDGAFKNGRLTLMPGETRRFLIAAAVGCKGEEDDILKRLRDILAQCERPTALMDELCAQYLNWFDDLPDFSCSDAFMERCWWYRFYILRKNMAVPDRGYLKHTVFYEGRAHALPKSKLIAGLWEFSRLIPLSTPLCMTDMRWSRKDGIVEDGFRSLIDSVNADGAFSVTSIDSNGKEYTNYSSWALYLYSLLNWNEDFIREVLPAFKRDVLSVYERHRGAHDHLQICYTHALTGKEYQPSYWFFTNQCFPAKVRGTTEGYTPLKRVDSSIYTYLNMRGLQKLCEKIGNEDAQAFGQCADSIRTEVLQKMWDETSGFFYDLHHITDQKAYVKNIVGCYPLWADITDDKHLRAFDYLLSESYFALGSGFASTAADCPVFSASGGWKGDYFKGRDGCLWNGPSWPYTTCIALDALAKQSKRHAHVYDAEFGKLLKQYTLEHFTGGDAEKPYLVEFYNAISGEPLSDEPDYNHSYYIDLIVRHVAGIEPEEGGFVFHPADAGLAHFALKNIRVQNHTVDVYYQNRQLLKYPELAYGYSLFVDGQKVAHFADLDELARAPLTYKWSDK